MRTFAVVNHKGGAGKTTTSVHLAWGLAERGYRTLLVDLDPQGALASYFRQTPRHTLYHAVWEGVSTEQCLVPIRSGLDALLADGTLAQLELVLAERPRREAALREALGQLGDYDAAVFDCPPSLSLIIVNAFYAAQSLIAPVQMELLSFRGLTQTLEYARFMGRYLQYQPGFFGVVPTMVREDNTWHMRWLNRTRKSLPPERVAAPIPYDMAIPEGLQQGRTVFEVDSASPAAQRYGQLVESVAADIGTREPQDQRLGS
ncbi:ParA family protein [Thiohalorhabdus sp. Cl-TMA]|uniref:ParA family protein n=1 Tax=Thiohalorhabdus methylotrophus TaxID=3242694 RepID=A0ABV4TVV1_9GAMM